MVDKTMLGKRIREARTAKNYTQEYVAEKAEMTVVYLSEIERGYKLPSLTMFVKIAEVLGVSTDSLLRDELDTGKTHVYHEITTKLESLTPKQRIAAVELLDTYIRNL